MRSPTRLILVLLCIITAPGAAFAQAPVAYRLSFPEAQHRLMEVDITFAELPAGPLQLRMSRSSPGRYAVHEFAKNIVDIRITDAMGSPLQVTKPAASQWEVSGHRGTVRVTYRIFGDRIDGTYLSVDSSHAHINMPAALMWARGLEDRPATVRFDVPSGSMWRVGTQLMPGSDPITFTAPNLQYLMDSPTEVSAFTARTFNITEVPNSPVFRLVVHHAGSDADVDSLTADVQKIVRESRFVYGEYPAFENNTYSFIADYLPWASGDGMEHRNSTILTSAGSIRGSRAGLLRTIAHEFFHAWNVERIRPRSLEPFNFDDANVSGELWLAEGFTNYYGPLISVRSGVLSLRDFATGMGETINEVITAPGRRVRSAEEMSHFAPFVDAAVAMDRTNFDNTFISYYTWGEAIGLGLDLTLRERSEGKITLDHYMRALWEKFGKPGGSRPGYVDNPYTMADLRSTLAAVSGDAAFADDFFRRYIQGREVVNYQQLLSRAGLLLRPRSPGRGFAGTLSMQEVQGRPRIVANVPMGSPAYEAGLDREDIILSVDGMDTATAVDVDLAIQRRRPGDSIPIVFERRGERINARLRLVEDPTVDLVPVEATGQPLSAAQRSFRDSWLSSAARNAF